MNCVPVHVFFFFYVECDINDLAQIPEVENSFCIFCLATYGEGDPTDNAQDFYDWLQNGETQITGLKYAVRAVVPRFKWTISKIKMSFTCLCLCTCLPAAMITNPHSIDSFT